MSSGMTFFQPPPQSNHHFSQMSPNYFSPQPPRFSSSRAFLPSPLRTSRNANVMSNPFSTKIEDQTTIGSEDANHNDAVKIVRQNDTVPSKPLFFLDSTSTTTPDADTSLRASKFQYESRARSSSPSVQLASHVAAGRNSRKNVFLDRLRHMRDDARFERNGDQMLRMDWLNERKAWEQEMSRRGNMNDESTLDEEDDMMDQDWDQDGENAAMEENVPPGAMSPTEDKELEELVSYFEQHADDEFDDSGEDYDALFMEVLDGGNGRCSIEMQNKPDVEMM